MSPFISHHFNDALKVIEPLVVPASQSRPFALRMRDRNRFCHNRCCATCCSSAIVIKQPLSWPALRDILGDDGRVDQSVAQRDAAQIKWTEERREMFVKQCHDNEMAHNKLKQSTPLCLQPSTMICEYRNDCRGLPVIFLKASAHKRGLCMLLNRHHVEAVP